MLPFPLNLDVDRKSVQIDMPSLKLNDQVLDYIRNYDYSQISICDFNQTHSFSSKIAPSNPQIDEIISSLFSVDLKDLESDEPEIPKKHRISLSETSFSMLSPESSVKKSKQKYKKQKLIDVYIPNTSSVLGSPPKSYINWKDLELSEINTICQEMIYSHADTNSLLDGLLRIIGNINLSWFYELDKKLPLYVYEQLLPRDDKILQILLKYYPEQVEDCIYYIIDNISDYQRLFAMLNTCFMQPSSNLQDASVVVIKHLLNDISLNKSVIIGLLKELSLVINNQNFPIAHYLFKQLLNGLYIFHSCNKNIKLIPIWLDILIDGLLNAKPFIGPTTINISSFPADTRNTWSSFLNTTSDPSSTLSNLPNLIFSLILPSFKCYLQPLLALKQHSNIQIRHKSTKMLFILYNLLPDPLQSKLAIVLVNLTRDKSPLVRDTALDICFHLPLSDTLQSIVIERIYDTSIKVRKSAIKFISHLFLNKPHYIHYSLLLLLINDSDIQPIILKSLQAMVLSQFPLKQSYFQLTPNDKEMVLDKSKLLVNALLWLSKYKSVDPTTYLRTFYQLLSKSNMKQIDHYFQMTVDCYMVDVTHNTNEHLLFCLIITQINPKWCFEYVSSFVSAMDKSVSEQQMALQILCNIAKVDSVIVHSSQLLSQLLLLMEHGNVQLIELSMPLLNELLPTMSDIDAHRVTEYLKSIYSQLSMLFTNRHALIIGLTMRFNHLYAILDVDPKSVLDQFRQFNSPIKFKCICDLVIGHGHLILDIKSDFLDTSANAQLLLQALLHVIQMEPINKLELVGEDVIDTLIVDALSLFLPLVDSMLQYVSIHAIRTLLSQLVFCVAQHGLVHPKMVCTLFYGLIMQDCHWFMKQDGYLVMMQKYPEIVTARLKHVHVTDVAFINPVLIGLNKKMQRVFVNTLLNKIHDMDEMAWIKMVVGIEWDNEKISAKLREIEMKEMVDDAYKGNCIGVALLGIGDKGILGKLEKEGNHEEIVMDIVENGGKKRKRED